MASSALGRRTMFGSLIWSLASRSRTGKTICAQVPGKSYSFLIRFMFHFISSNLDLDLHRIVIAVSSGGQHTVMIAKDKVEKETNGEGTGMEVNKGQEANGEAIQEEPGVNGGVEENMEEN